MNCANISETVDLQVSNQIRYYRFGQCNYQSFLFTNKACTYLSAVMTFSTALLLEVTFLFMTPRGCSVSFSRMQMDRQELRTYAPTEPRAWYVTTYRVASGHKQSCRMHVNWFHSDRPFYTTDRLHTINYKERTVKH